MAFQRKAESSATDLARADMKIAQENFMRCERCHYDDKWEVGKKTSEGQFGTRLSLVRVFIDGTLSAQYGLCSRCGFISHNIGVMPGINPEQVRALVGGRKFVNEAHFTRKEYDAAIHRLRPVERNPLPFCETTELA